VNREQAEALRENAMGEYANAGLGIGVCLALGTLTGLLLGSPAIGLASGIAIGLLVEGILEMQDYRCRRSDQDKREWAPGRRSGSSDKRGTR
jgi:hypothetical protein